MKRACVLVWDLVKAVRSLQDAEMKTGGSLQNVREKSNACAIAEQAIIDRIEFLERIEATSRNASYATKEELDRDAEIHCPVG